MKPNRRSLLSVLAFIALVCDLASEEEPNIVILATGGTIAAPQPRELKQATHRCGNN
jgi:L-asparaginase/Glu-tRNA(Gln) amidotransferase subunit D